MATKTTPDLDEAVAMYLRWLARQPGKAGPYTSEHTMKTRRSQLKQLTDHLGQIQVGNVTVNHVESFRDSMIDDEASASHMNGTASALHGFFEWCIYRPVNRGELVFYHGTNPSHWWKAMKVTPVPKIRIPESEWPRLFEETKDPRSRFFLQLGLFVWARIGECRLFTFRSIDEEKQLIDIFRPKTGTLQHIGLTPAFMDCYHEWRDFYQHRLAQQGIKWSDDFKLFPAYATDGRNEFGQMANSGRFDPRRSIVAPQYIVHDALTLLGYDPEMWTREGGHTLRRSGASAMYEYYIKLGISDPIDPIREQLGHVKRSTTELYLNVGASSERQKELARVADTFGRRIDVGPAMPEPIIVPAGRRSHLSIVRNVG